LLYLFHPSVGQFTLLVNGQPVTEPLFRLAAVPALLVVILFIGVLSVLAMLGVGMFLFLGALGIALLSMLFIAPYFWPILLMFCLIISIMSSGVSHKPK
jgi:hypothetical protein